MDIYSEILLDHYKHPRNQGKLKNPTHRAAAANPFCGDEVVVELKVGQKDSRTGGQIEDVRFRATGCAVSVATMSMLSERLKGRGVGEVERLNEETIQEMLGIKLTPTRVKCAMVGLGAVKRALNRSGHASTPV